MAGLSQGGGVGLALATWMTAGDHGDSGMDIWAMDVARYGDYATLAYTNAKVQENYRRRFRITFPNEELPDARPLLTTPIHDRLTDANAVWGATFGLEHALWFQRAGLEPKEDVTFRRSNAWECVAEEVAAVRERVGMTEISNYAKYRVTGPGAEAWLSSLLTARMPAPGRITLTAMLNDAGRIVGEFTVARATDADEFYLFGSLPAEVHHSRWFRHHLPADGSVRFEVLGLGLVGLSVAGPRSRDVLAAVAPDLDLSTEAFPFMTFRRVDLGMIPVHLARINYAGDLGYELWVAPEYQRALFDRIVAAGEPHGLRLFGMRALMSLRLEKSYGTWFREYRPIYTPAEGGITRYIRLDHEFIGRAAHEAEMAAGGPKRRLVAFVVEPDPDDPADVIGDEPVWHDGKVVGWITSGGYGHHVKAVDRAGLRADGAGDAGRPRRRRFRDRDHRPAAAGAAPARAAVRPVGRADARVTSGSDQMTTTASGPVAIRCGRLLDVETGQVAEARVLYVGPGRPHRSHRWRWRRPPRRRDRPSTSPRYTSCPGSIDIHTHLVGDVQTAGVPVDHDVGRRGGPHRRSARPPRRSRPGFTTVRDVGSFRAFSDCALRDAIDAGDVVGPRMQCAGAFITAPWGGGDVVGLARDIVLPEDLRFGVVRSVDEVRERVRRLLIGGANLIKCIGTGAVLTRGGVPGAPELSEAELRAAVEEAAWYEAFVAVHAHGAEGAKRAIRAGARSIEHGSYLDDEAISMLADTGTFLSRRPVRRRVGARARRASRVARRDDAQDGGVAGRGRGRRAARDRRGVRIVFGTDSGVYPHGLNARQFAWYTRCGMTPLDAIRTATTVAADAMGWSDRVGSLAVGRYARPRRGRRRSARRHHGPRAAARGRQGRAGRGGSPVNDTAGRIVVDGRPIEARDGDSIAVAIVRAGEPPGRGGTLCLAGDCGNCLAVVDGIAYVRTCQVPARPGSVVVRHPADGNPPLPVRRREPGGDAARAATSRSSAALRRAGRRRPARWR